MGLTEETGRKFRCLYLNIFVKTVASCRNISSFRMPKKFNVLSAEASKFRKSYRPLPVHRGSRVKAKSREPAIRAAVDHGQELRDASLEAAAERPDSNSRRSPLQSGKFWFPRPLIRELMYTGVPTP
jgi:hypothetical protein